MLQKDCSACDVEKESEWSKIGEAERPIAGSCLGWKSKGLDDFNLLRIKEER